MKRLIHYYLPFLFLCCGVMALSLNAQPFTRPIPFAMQLHDSLNTTNLMTYQPPITDSSRIVVQDGHFALKNGKRIRLVGTTISYSACFPDSAEAIAIARRFHDLGINALRMRGWDLTIYGGYLLPFLSQTTDTTFNPVYIDRLDWFLYQLKKNGVYVFLSNIGFLPLPNDKVLGSDSIQYNTNVRAVQYFHQGYQEAHKKFLRRFFNHVNSYTKIPYKNEPTIAMMALTDENSLVDYWAANFVEGQTKILSFHLQRHLDTLFNLWLRKKYGTDATLKTAWSNGSVNTTNMVRDPGFEDAFTSPWTLQQGNNGSTALLAFSDADKYEGTQSMRIRIQNGGVNFFDIQLFQGQFNLTRGKQYKISFWAKTSAQQQSRPVTFYMVRGESPYNSFGIQQQVTLSSTWQEYTTSFTASDTHPNVLFLFGLGGSSGDVYVDKMSVSEDNPITIVNGESLNTYTVTTLVNRSPAGVKRIYETTDFMNQVTEQYYDSMTRFLRDTIKCPIVIGGNGLNGSLNDLYTARKTDFTAHTTSWGYFLRYNGSPDSLWTLFPTPATEIVYGAQMSAMARGKVKGVPFILNNYFQTYPTGNYNELLTYVPAYAAFQDWDAFFINEWCNDINRLDSASITKFGVFEIKNQNALQALAPAAMRAWKEGLISMGEEVVSINHIPEQHLYQRWQTDGYYLSASADPRIPFFRRMELDSFDAKYSSFLPHLAIPEYSDPNGLDMSKVQTDTKQILWNQVDGWLKVNTPRYLCATGKLNKAIMDFDGISVEKTDANTYGTFSWISADTSAIVAAPRSLLTIASRVQNKGAIWDGDSSLWRGWGTGSIEAEALTIRFSLKSACDTLIIYPLNEHAEKTNEVMKYLPSGSGRFSFELDQSKTKALWYVIEQRSKPSEAMDVNDTYAENSALSISPNPAANAVYIDYPVSQAATLISISTIDGRILEQRQQPSNSNYAIFETSAYADGVYIVRAQSGTTSHISKMIIRH